jgi:flavin-dependent dehydrogenase
LARFKPAALRTDASKIMERPIMKATTGFPWWRPVVGGVLVGVVAFMKRAEAQKGLIDCGRL